jgi:predicted transport protein
MENMRGMNESIKMSKQKKPKIKMTIEVNVGFYGNTDFKIIIKNKEKITTCDGYNVK